MYGTEDLALLDMANSPEKFTHEGCARPTQASGKDLIVYRSKSFPQTRIDSLSEINLEEKKSVAIIKSDIECSFSFVKIAPKTHKLVQTCRKVK